MDFLGLRSRPVIQKAPREIERESGVSSDMDEFDYDDNKVLSSRGPSHTDSVFQLESAGMKSFMKELKPQNLEDVIAGISLYRPGPMDFIPKYIEGKNNPENIHYDCPQLQPILEPTYGCIVYQEQVMQIVRALGGYTLGRSDLVRRAMAELPGRQREVLYLKDIEGYPTREIAGMVACDEAQVRVILSRARNALRGILKKMMDDERAERTD